MAQTENQKKLLKILNELFQLDQSDLDFGIYRIMNSKSDEINEFLKKDLLSSVSKAFSANENNSIQSELDEAVQQAQALGVEPDTIPKVKELKEKLSSTTSASNLENDVFSHLANFFKRYYKDGDFVSLRRYKKDTYAIPYEGEEVKLHWANSDQYYIKSGEYFRDYTFKVQGRTVHLKLSDAETEQNNNKAASDKERRFVILESAPCEIIDGELYIHFEYKAVGKEKQDKLNEKAIALALENIEDEDFKIALSELAPTEKNKHRTILEKHLKSYTSRNSFDYFIHKDLGGFLGRELDFYIKNEMLFLDDILDNPIKYEEVMGKVKIFKEVAQKIIAFLTQLEEMQKKLWEKKKFVIETNYCITLDKIDEDYYPEIFDNKEQLAEWKVLFDVDVQSVDDLKGEECLVLDTKFFDMKFKYKLLSEFDNLDEEINGVLINSENFGALSLLQDRYKQQVETVYIDPPYNAKSSEILYMNSYKHSSFISFIENRIKLSHGLLSQKGFINVAIDDYEYKEVNHILEQKFGRNNFISNITVVHNPRGRNDDKFFGTSHEYMIVYAKNSEQAKLGMFPLSNEDRKIFNLEDDISKYHLVSYTRTGNNSSRHERPNLFYPIYYNEITNKLSIDKLENTIEILPINSSNEEKTWRWGKETFLDRCDTEITIKKAGGTYKLYKRRRVDEAGKKPKTVWSDSKYDASSHGIMYLRNILTKENEFSYPKSINTVFDAISLTSESSSYVLDFFAGSGTTGEAVLKLNRVDDGKRKYILVEMGEYFNTVTKPRMQKVIYTDSWKNGKPQDKKGISQVFKYFKLESYEDTLNNLEFKRTNEQQQALDLNPQAKEDYLLNYALDVESQGSLLNIDNFASPFNYKLKIATSSVGETKNTIIDLVETFNYLLGLVVKRMEMLKGFLVVEGQNLKKERILIIWRDGQSSDELNEFFNKMDWSVYDREFDTIYVNGDNNLDNLRKDEDHFKVRLIEQEFKALMFGE